MRRCGDVARRAGAGQRAALGRACPAGWNWARRNLPEMWSAAGRAAASRSTSIAQLLMGGRRSLALSLPLSLGRSLSFSWLSLGWETRPLGHGLARRRAPRWAGLRVDVGAPRTQSGAGATVSLARDVGAFAWCRLLSGCVVVGLCNVAGVRSLFEQPFGSVWRKLNCLVCRGPPDRCPRWQANIVNAAAARLP